MFTFIKNFVPGYKKQPVSFQHIKQNKQASSLAVMLPGRGYTVQGPLFHYSTGVFLNKGFDVLHVNYDYNTVQSESMTLEEEIKQITEDVNAVLDYILKNQPYENYTLIGKSLGTIALSSIIDQKAFMDAKVIWLTPLLQLDYVLDKMISSTQKGLCIIGDEDPCFVPERYEKLNIKENMQTLLIPGTEHSLNYVERPIDSIDVLKKVIAKISSF
ncbi:alpha/beta hydrolase [Mesobacillus boroniphilus]|uniref:Alpha/beta hydrolase n=1 Tax=Mesobacillus boroniphilus TaxID=308892 RepID=A0A944GW52_9BACI|nr:alpha/beta hydrolase [Mesobacillus boroniphilus]MBS8264352.1 alpha/beta hydrolase [Mesobacillus boroniphilus]